VHIFLFSSIPIALKLYNCYLQIDPDLLLLLLDYY